jgi:hypothetical protein
VARRFYSAHNGHAEVHEHNLRFERSNFFDCLFPIGGFSADNEVRVAFKQTPNTLAHNGVIIDQENLVSHFELEKGAPTPEHKVSTGSILNNTAFPLVSLKCHWVRLASQPPARRRSTASKHPPSVFGPQLLRMFRTSRSYGIAA